MALNEPVQNENMESEGPVVEEIVSPVQPERRIPMFLDMALVLAVMLVFLSLLTYKYVFFEDTGASTEMELVNQQEESTFPVLDSPTEVAEVSVGEPMPAPKISSSSTTEPFDGSAVAVGATNLVSPGQVSGTVSINNIEDNLSFSVLEEVFPGVILQLYKDEKFVVLDSKSQHGLVYSQGGVVVFEVYRAPLLFDGVTSIGETLQLLDGSSPKQMVTESGDLSYELNAEFGKILALFKGDYVYYLMDYKPLQVTRKVEVK